MSTRSVSLTIPANAVLLISKVCNLPAIAYYFSIVKPRDPEQERRRLADLYVSMTDEELRSIAEDPKSLTEVAIEALNSEFARRGTDLKLEIPNPEPVKSNHPEIPNLVILRQFRDLPEALLAKGGLESAGIECFFKDDNIVRLDWYYSNAVGGIKLLVRADDFAAANEILEQGIPGAFEVSGVGEFEQPRCPQCNSLDVTFVVRNKIAMGGVTGIGLSYLIDRNFWKCNSCDHGWLASGDGDAKP